MLQILRISNRYNPEKDMIQFANGTWLNRDELQQGGFGPLTATIFNFARSLKHMACDETEFAMLSAVCLISGGKLIARSFILCSSSATVFHSHLPSVPPSPMSRPVCLFPSFFRKLKGNLQNGGKDNGVV